MVPTFLFARLTASFTCRNSTQIHVGSLLQHHAFVFFNSFTSTPSSESESESHRKPHKGDTFTVSYLVNSCGFSPELAHKLSRKVNLKNPDAPNAVLDLLRNYGFSKTQVAKLVKSHPLVLVANAEATLLPKLKFLHSIGVSIDDMPEIIINSYKLLVRSLEKCIVPLYEILRGVVRDNEEAIRALTNALRGHCVTHCDLLNDLVLNIGVLRQSGVPQASISILVIHFPTVARAKHARFVEAVKTVKEIGFDPMKTTFVLALQVLLTMSKAVWGSKFDLFERWGWRRETVVEAFRVFPNFMKLSEDCITRKMSFLVKDMGWPSEDIARYPSVLGYNLEKRIIPRFSVIKLLKSKGLVKDDVHISGFMSVTEAKFLKKFVVNFQEDVPDLPLLYLSLINNEDVK